MAESKPPPKCKAILLCDQTILDATSGKVSIIGIFDLFNLPQFPGMLTPFMAFLQMTDGIGRYSITLEIHDLQGDVVVARAEGPEIDFPERASKINFATPVPALTLQHPGVYDFVVFADGQEIDRQKFTAQTPGGPGDVANPDEE